MIVSRPRRLRLAYSWAPVLLLLVSACGDDEAPGPGPEGGGSESGRDAGPASGRGGAGSGSSGKGGSGSAGTAGAGAGQAGVGQAGAGQGAAGRAGASGSTAGASGSAGGGGLATTDEPWMPPELAPGSSAQFADEIGWRTSDRAVCSDKRGRIRSHAVYSDAGGVYSAVSTSCNQFQGDCTGAVGTSLLRNDGSEWSELVHDDFPEEVRITGFPNGTLVVYGPVADCGIQFVNRSGSQCSHEPAVLDVFVVDDTLAYALQFDRVLRYDGERWSDFGAPFESQAAINPRALWADRSRVVIAGEQQTVLVSSGDQAEFSPLEDVPAGTYVSVWGEPDGALWLGNDQGQLLRYDGEQFEVVHTVEPCHGDGITGLWRASEGTLFFMAGTQLGAVRGDEVDVIADLGCEPAVLFNDLWGNSATELFLSIADVREAERSCGQTISLWYDGDTLQQF